jgi:hypothetical protein
VCKKRYETMGLETRATSILTRIVCERYIHTHTSGWLWKIWIKRLIIFFLHLVCCLSIFLVGLKTSHMYERSAHTRFLDSIEFRGEVLWVLEAEKKLAIIVQFSMFLFPVCVLLILSFLDHYANVEINILLNVWMIYYQ